MCTMDIYAQNILDRYKKPFYKDKFNLSGKRVAGSGKLNLVIHKEANHSCGDVVEVGMKFVETQNLASLQVYSFSGNGCAISMASADMLGDVIVGMNMEDILNFSKDELYEVLGIEISVRRSKCALLPLLAIQNGVLGHQKEALKSWKDYHI